LPDLLRRVAVRTVVFAVAMGLIVPLSVRSASSVPAETKHLIDVAAGAGSVLNRGLPDRSYSASLSLQNVPPLISVEALEPSAAPGPGSVSPVLSFGVIPRPPAQIVPAPISGSLVSGRASWYCCSAGWRGEAVVALPGALGGRYDPPPASRYVTFCATRCAKLPVVDYCDCYWGTDTQKVADLSPEAWTAITDTNRFVAGVVQVTVHFGG
jgi:hypothetical protein